MLQNVLHNWNDMVKGYLKYIFYPFLNIFILPTFYYITGFCKKKFQFLQVEGEGQFNPLPPPANPSFQVPPQGKG